MITIYDYLKKLFIFQNEVGAALAEAGNNGHHKLNYWYEKNEAHEMLKCELDTILCLFAKCMGFWMKLCDIFFKNLYIT